MGWRDFFKPKTNPQQATPSPAVRTSRVAPMPNMFVCAVVNGSSHRLCLVDDKGQIAAEVVRLDASRRLGEYAVSPDARWVAYTSFVSGRADCDPMPTIFAAPASGGASQELLGTSLESCYQNPVFSPAGGEMVCEFGFEQDYNPDLQVLELEEIGDRLMALPTGTRIVNPLHIGNHAARYMPDGKRIVYFCNFAYEDLLEVCLFDPAHARWEGQGAVGWRLTENADGVWRRPRAIAVQPKWEQIFFIQGHTRDTERICVFLLPDLAPGTFRKVFNAVGREHHRIGGLDVSADGLNLCYDGDGATYVVAADGSLLRQISPDGLQSRCARFSKDGRRIAFIGDGVLHVADVDSREEARALPIAGRIESFVLT